MTAEISNPQSAQSAGSPPTGEPVFLVVGKLRRPHGVRGEILMEVYTDFPERITAGKTVFLGDDHVPMEIESCRGHQQGLLITFRGVHVREEAGEMRNRLVFIDSDAIPELAQGEFYHHQLIGLRVFDEHRSPLGVVTSLLETGANDILVVKNDNRKDLLMPITDEVVLNIDLQNGEMLVHLIPGLLQE